MLEVYTKSVYFGRLSDIYIQLGDDKNTRRGDKSAYLWSYFNWLIVMSKYNVSNKVMVYVL